MQSEVPCTRQLIDQYEQTEKSVIGVQAVSIEQTDRYGIVDPIDTEGKLVQVRRFVEKPALGSAPSNLAIMGRYVLTPRIFEFLDRHELGAGGEIQLTDAIQKLNEDEGVYAFEFDGKRYDVGEKLGFITTVLEFALQNKELRSPLLTVLDEIVQREQANKFILDR
ncbi:hypothetical protein PCURB6_01270 [Paenibacillus curdlanolyticus]|nr:hypothetical protein PCURB6_01270 [Paenibacillus curdlanolyticus]